MENHNVFFEALESQNIFFTETQKRNITHRINSILNYKPKIGVFGKTGVGKSSLCNALFGQEICPISDIEACTREPKEVLLKMGGKGITLLDVPGVGENRERDKEYAQLYAKLLPELDLVLWVLKADDRANTSDEEFFSHLVKPHVDQGKPFFFVINQVDKIEPFREWDVVAHEPGVNQFRNISQKIDVLASTFSQPRSRFIEVSASEKYNLIRLVDEIIYALPNEKKITVYNAVDSSHHTEGTTNHVGDSFWDAISDIIASVGSVAMEVVKEAIPVVVKHAASAITGGFSNFVSWFFSLF